MLLEDFLPESWWVHNPWSLAFLAAAYSIISLFIAVQVFGGNPGVVSIAFLTLFLLPSIMLIRRHDLMERLSENKTWLQPVLMTKAYTAYFTGTFFTYLATAFILPLFGVDVVSIVREQLILLPGMTGAAVFSFAKFSGIFANNWFVLILVFFFATIWRDGGMFFVLWNASAWGAIFGYRAMGAAAAAGVNPWYYLGVELSQVIWHTALEGGAYILAAVAGSVIGRHAYGGDEPPYSFVGGLLGIFTVTFGMKTILSTTALIRIIQTLIGILSFFAAAYVLRHQITDNDSQFQQGMTILSGALALFAIGALVETLVLENSTSLQTVYRYSSMYIR